MTSLQNVACTLALLVPRVVIAQLPPDHPPINSQGESDMALPGQPDFLKQLEEGPKGTLTVHAIQGTKDGGTLLGDEVEVTLFHRDVAIKQFKSVLDDQGTVVIPDIPVAIGVSPLVRIRHAGVQYQDSAPDMSPDSASASVDITVYEVTDQIPEWKYVMRHIVVEKRDGGYVASDVVIVENLGDRTWMGEPADPQKRRATVPLPLPTGAFSIELVQGFHGWCCSATKDSTLQVQMPFMPGTMTYKFAYRLMPRGGVLDVRLAMPKDADRAAIFVPDDGTPVDAFVVTEAGVDTSGSQRLRMFEAKSIPANQSIGISLKLPVQLATKPSASESNSSIPPWVILGGGTVAIIGGALAWKALGARSKSM